MDSFTGDVRATVGADGTPIIEVVDAGPLRVSLLVITGRWARLADGIVSFLGVDRAGNAIELRYRVIGVEPGGEHRAGWLLTEPVG